MLQVIRAGRAEAYEYEAHIAPATSINNCDWSTEDVQRAVEMLKNPQLDELTPKAQQAREAHARLFSVSH